MLLSLVYLLSHSHSSTVDCWSTYTTPRSHNGLCLLGAFTLVAEIYAFTLIAESYAYTTHTTHTKVRLPTVMSLDEAALVFKK